MFQMITLITLIILSLGNSYAQSEPNVHLKPLSPKDQEIFTTNYINTLANISFNITDTNKDGIITRNEYAISTANEFLKADINKDLKLTYSEFYNHYSTIYSANKNNNDKFRRYYNIAISITIKEEFKAYDCDNSNSIDIYEASALSATFYNIISQEQESFTLQNVTDFYHSTNPEEAEKNSEYGCNIAKHIKQSIK